VRYQTALHSDDVADPAAFAGLIDVRWTLSKRACGISKSAGGTGAGAPGPSRNNALPLRHAMSLSGAGCNERSISEFSIGHFNGIKALGFKALI
jgi:hypothetical protein